MEQYELNWKNYYGILGVNPGAEPEVVRAAYTALARKYHPDAGGSAQRMKEINEAYEVLSDQQRKTWYDLYCRQKSGGSSQSRTRREQPPPQPPPPPRPADKPGILPWPSLAWQRVALFTSIPLGIGLMTAPLDLWFTVSGIFVLLIACFAAVKTRGLSRMGEGWTAAKVGAGFCITSSLCVLGAVMLVLAVVFIAAAVIIFAVKGLLAS